MLLRHYLEQGLSKAAIARLIGVSLRTLYHWIASGQLDRDLDDVAVRYGPRPPKACKLDGYKALIVERLSAYPRLSATRLFEEVRKAGYAGGYSQLKVYVRSVRPQPAPEPVQRFETPPGLQAQVDFAEFRLPWGVRYALVVVLGYSRLLWFKFYPRQTMAVLMAGLEEAFTAFGGVPKELLFDQLKAVIVDDERMTGGKLLENAQFQRFAAHWGFRIRACRPYRAKTKGKVERPIGYVRQAFFYGREFVSDDDLNGQSLEWQAQTANRRLHRTVLVVDEIGYLPVSHDGAVLFFQLMNRRYERASTVLTSNKGFEEWGNVLGDDVMAAALIDRVLHHCHLVNIRGNSYRMRHHRTNDQDEPSPSPSKRSARRN